LFQLKLLKLVNLLRKSKRSRKKSLQKNLLPKNQVSNNRFNL
jgi:hypothetical protein